MSSDLSAAEFAGLRDLLHQWTGIFLADNKRHLVVNRLHRPVAGLGLDRYADYVKLLHARGPASSEARVFINSLTTNKTSFFREPGHFEFLRQEVVRAARVRADAGAARQLRVWCAAASTGEEPYTLAMVLCDSLPANENWDARILATDVDTDVLATGQRGVYAEAQLAGVPPALRRFFRRGPAPDEWQVEPALARMITFTQANLVAEPFPVRGRFDAIFCRNVMIYFDRTTQIRLVGNLVDQLAPGGHLIVGHSESLIGFPLALETAQVGVYRPASASSRADAVLDARARASSRSAVAPRPAISPEPVRAAALAPRAGSATATRSPRRRPVAVHPAPPLSGAGALPRTRIVLGQWFTSREPAMVTTVLGSCVAACLFDPVARVGGMNHFMLPDGDQDAERPARFGVHAMEVVINELMGHGAARDRIIAKVFGAGSVTEALSPRVAEANAAFIRQFLIEEGIPLMAERLGGKRPREVMMRTDTGEAFCRVLEERKAAPLTTVEVAAWRGARPDDQDKPDPMSSVELF